MVDMAETKDFTDEDLVKLHAWKQMYPELPEYWVEAAYRYCQSTNKPITNSERRKLKRAVRENFTKSPKTSYVPEMHTEVLTISDNNDKGTEDGGPHDDGPGVHESRNADDDAAHEGPVDGSGVSI